MRFPDFNGILLRIRWRFRYRRFIRPGNRFFDPEVDDYRYTGAPYCLDCRKPMMEYLEVCDECKAKDNTINIVVPGVDDRDRLKF